MIRSTRAARLLVVLAALLLSAAGRAQLRAPELEGLWTAHARFGPEVSGALMLSKGDSGWTAEIAGYRIAVHGDRNGLRFELPGGRGRFSGRLDDGVVTGAWIQPPPMQIGMPMLSPVYFKPVDDGRWWGAVIPLPSEYTFFLPVGKAVEGRFSAFLRNPDRNLGLFLNVSGIEADGSDLRFVGTAFRSREEEVLFEGRYHPDGDYVSAFLPAWRGGTYSFFRDPAAAASHFYARSRDAPPPTYAPPVDRGDGWRTGTLQDASMRFAPLRDMIVREIDPPAESVNDYYVHAVLIARHGRLVFEEYFHGFHSDIPHDTRSASKSMASVLVGAAVHSGLPVATSMPVYASVLGDALPARLSQRRTSMTLEHLLTMSSGLYCDDNDGEAPGNENRMQEQEAQPDWYRYTLDVPMALAPGDQAIYCSANTNLIGAVLTAATGRSVADLIESLIAAPLGIENYHLGLQPTGEVYLGGGSRWRPRDIMKLGQLMLNGGEWNGRRIVSAAWAEASTSTRTTIGDRDYGYQWWLQDYPFKGRTVRAFFAGGNGGQIVMGIPELGLLVAFFGGNYSDRTGYRTQVEVIPNYILKAIDE